MRKYSYWSSVFNQFSRKPLGMVCLGIVLLFCLVAIYAPFLACSKPFYVIYDGVGYFPLLRYLFFSNFYTKYLDIFFNLLIFSFPLFLLVFRLPRYRRESALILVGLQFLFFLYLVFDPIKDPAVSPLFNHQKEKTVTKFFKQAQDVNSPLPEPYRTWAFELAHMTPYAKLNMLIAYRLEKEHNQRLEQWADNKPFESRWQQNQQLFQDQLKLVESNLHKSQKDYQQWIQQGHPSFINAKERQFIISYQENEVKKHWLLDREKWLRDQSKRLEMMIMPLVRPFHWEDDAGGSQSLNQLVPWYELTRTNRKDLVAALIFGVRVSLVVGITSIMIAFLIGLPIGALAGFYAGRFDIIVCRLIEIWESMPVFFMLLLIVSITQSKSIFIVIAVIGLFAWTSFCRYTRGEFFKQRHLPYVEACHAQGFSHGRIIFHHILPNAIPPLLTLMPFSIMAAMTSEAALSFLGLGEEGSCSWGVLMSEGRSVFPGESYLLWPPAILLTVLLIAIALVGDALRDAIDPKLHVIANS